MRRFVPILALMLVLLLASCGLGYAEPRLITTEQPRLRTISVTGDAEVRVAPDEIIITLGVQTWDKELARAKAENDRIMRDVLAVAQAAGVADRHIQTDYINIEPRYRDSYERSDFIGYFVSKTAVITLKEIARFEELLGQLLEAGATHIHGVDFRTTELRKHRDEARALAIQAAREKAVALASELGQRVGEPVSIREEQSSWWAWSSSWWGTRGGSMAQNVIQNLGGGEIAADSVVAPGQIAVNARVSVEFAIE